MPISFQVGPIMVDSRILITIVSVMVGLWVIRLKTKRLEDISKVISDLMFNNVFIVFLFWKFGSLLFAPSIIWTKPVQILLLTGSWKEILLGLMIACIYTIYKLKKTGISSAILLDVLPFGILSAATMKHMLWWEYGMPTQLPWGISLTNPELRYHPLHLYALFLSILIMIWLTRSQYKLGTGKSAQDFFIYYGIGLFLISFFQVSTVDFLFFSYEQMIYAGMVALGLTLPYILKWERG